MYKIEKLQKSDYDDLLNFLNVTFNRLNERTFEAFLPAMWHRNDEIMGKNFAIKKDGNIIAAMGVYPLKANILGEDVLFATTGNVAVSQDYRNLGLMKQLMNYAIDELKTQKIDSARLGGDRLRYNRYGYEYLGQSNNYILTAKNIKSLPETEDYIFVPISKDDTNTLSFIRNLYSSKPFFIDRGDERNIFNVMSAYYSTPYIVLSQDRTPIGAISVSSDKDRIYDFYGKDEKTEFNVLCSWLKQSKLDKLYFNSPQWTNEFNILANSICEETTISYATQCKILNWEKLINAFSKLKNSYCNNRCIGSIIIEIVGYGTLEIDCTGCNKTNKKPDITLNSLTATRLIFGMHSPDCVISVPKDKSAIVNSLFPLPFWWNNQDRV